MKTALIALTTLATACTDDAQPDLECTDLPGSARMAGVVLDERGGAPIHGAFVEVHTIADQSLLGTAFSGVDGSYAMPAASDLPTIRHAQAQLYLEAFAYDPMPRSEGLLPLPMLTYEGADDLAHLAGVERDLSAGMILVIALDCAGHPIEGATIAAPGAQSMLYLGADTRFDPALTETSTDSAALLVNVPAGPVDITIEVDGQVHTTTIESRANALVTTWGR